MNEELDEDGRIKYLHIKIRVPKELEDEFDWGSLELKCDDFFEKHSPPGIWEKYANVSFEIEWIDAKEDLSLDEMVAIKRALHFTQGRNLLDTREGESALIKVDKKLKMAGYVEDG